MRSTTSHSAILFERGRACGLEDAWGIVDTIRGQIIPAFDAAREELVSLRPDAQVLADRLMGCPGWVALAGDRSIVQTVYSARRTPSDTPGLREIPGCGRVSEVQHALRL